MAREGPGSVSKGAYGGLLRVVRRHVAPRAAAVCPRVFCAVFCAALRGFKSVGSDAWARCGLTRARTFLKNGSSLKKSRRTKTSGLACARHSDIVLRGGGGGGAVCARVLAFVCVRACLLGGIGRPRS